MTKIRQNAPLRGAFCLIFVIFQSVFGQLGVILKKQEEPTFDLVFGQVGVTLKKQQEPTFDLVFGQF